MKQIFILITIIFITLLLLYKISFFRLFKIERFQKYNSIEYVPKIIHQIAAYKKREQKNWPKIWFKCQQSWKKKFPSPEYKYILWTEKEMDELVKKYYNWFYNVYKNYDKDIKRIDMVRCMILHKYGGIYADMDILCNKNFYDKINHKKISIVESPYKYNEFVQNSLMTSPQNHQIWIYILNKAIPRRNVTNIHDSTGPRLLSTALCKHNIGLYYKRWKKFKYTDFDSNINILDYRLYNPKKYSKSFKKDNVYTKHFLTSVWKKE